MRGTHAKQAKVQGLRASAAVSDRPSVSRVIHAPLKSYEIYAGRDHVRTRGLRLLILKSMYVTLHRHRLGK